MDTIGRLHQYLAYKRIPIARAEDLCGFSRSYLRRVKTMSEDKLCMILTQFHDLNKVWLLTGEGNMIKSGMTVSQTNVNGNNIAGDYYAGSHHSGEGLPVLPMEVYSESGITIKEYFDGNPVNTMPQIPLLPRCDFYAYVYTDAMQPQYLPGDLVACKYADGLPVINGAVYVVTIRGIGSVLRRLYERPDGYECRAFDTDNYESIKVRRDDVHGLASVLGMLRINR